MYLVGIRLLLARLAPVSFYSRTSLVGSGSVWSLRMDVLWHGSLYDVERIAAGGAAHDDLRGTSGGGEDVTATAYESHHD
jgi:hypothetical protein